MQAIKKVKGLASVWELCKSCTDKATNNKDTQEIPQLQLEK
jgi:hypothetical protein